MVDTRRMAPLPALIAACMALQSCGGPPPAPPAGPALYSGLRETMEGVDASALAGVRIVIDPGHGGRYDGAVGPTGLREADVNLGVALSLWGLLSDAGADVTLTRSSDRAVAGREDASLRDDLLARSEIANEARADLFISIHHNSDLSRDPSLNRIETYRKLFDDGPSLDAARALHRHLSYNIGETRGGVIAGNYLVLRTCDGAAVLGEPSFISNPRVEERLREADAQRMEAEAYFLGLVEYFSKGVPRLTVLAPSPGGTTGPFPEILVHADAGRGAIDPSSVETELDGSRVPAAYDPRDGSIAYRPNEPLPAGLHIASVRARNTGGNWSSTAAFDFVVKTAPAYLTLDVQRDDVSTSGAAPGAGRRAPGGAAGAASSRAPRALEARVFDAGMNPVAYGTPVAFRGNRPTFPETSLVSAGTAVAYVIPDPHGAFEASASSGNASMGMAVDTGYDASAGRWWAFLRDGDDGSPVAAARVSAAGRPIASSNRDGFVSLGLNEGNAPSVRAPGYEWRPGEPPELEEAPFDSSPNSIAVNVLRLRRAALGLLKGRTFVIDPEGGGDDRAGQGPCGTSASWVNYEVAAALARLIESSGGRALLTRARGEEASEVRRLAETELAGAFRYILISHRPTADGRAWIGHYPGSVAGTSLAESISEAAARLLPAAAPGGPEGGVAPVVRDDAGYTVRQTSAPAVVVNLRPLNDRSTEYAASEPWGAAAEAYAVYAGLLSDLDAEGALTADLLAFRMTAPGRAAAAGALVTLDGYLELMAGGDGELAVTSLTPGGHTLEVRYPGCASEIVEFGWPPETGGSTVTVELAGDGARR
jgi:N-acetylmuramoyl-L-alanine amidase